MAAAQVSSPLALEERTLIEQATLNSSRASLNSASEFRNQRLKNVFSQKTFSESVRVASERINELIRFSQIQGVKLEQPDQLMSAARSLMSSANSEFVFDKERFARILDLYISTGIKVHSRGYMARQFSAVMPVSAVFDMVSAIAPQPASFYEAGQLANVADKIIRQELAQILGWQDLRPEMITTSGGSLANLTAILTARNVKFPDSWASGIGTQSNQMRPAIAISEDAHYSVSRVPGILGLGQNQIVKLKLNGKREICVEQAISAIEAAKQDNLNVFCLVASAGSTATGAIDNLDELADYARARNIWFHVDACHSGAYLLSPSLRPKLRGIEKADSFCIDAHKMLFVPALCSLLFYRDGKSAASTFSQTASYVFDDHLNEMTSFESAAKNFECTKRPAILNFWLMWALYGPEVFAEKLEYLYNLAQDAYGVLEEQPDFRTLHIPASNILCFEYRPHGLPESRVNALQKAIWDRIRSDGRFFISKVELGSQTALRVVFMNHEITLHNFYELLCEVRKVGRSLSFPEQSA
jgi:L-2,4-diaminobutyrate decarboxylase